MQAYSEIDLPPDLAAAQKTHEASTLGWDTVFAVTYEDINEAIVKRKSSPSKLNIPAGGPFNFAVTADFADWKIFPGGDGSEVYFLLPVKNLKANYVLKGKPGALTCDEMMITVAVKLALLPHHGQATDPDGKVLPAPAHGTKRHALKLRTKGTTARDPIASIVEVDFRKPLFDAGTTNVDSDAEIPLRTALDRWMLTQIQVFEHIFAFVDLNDHIDHGDFAFTKPVTSSYAVCDRLDKKSGFLAMLSMTTDDQVPSIQQVGTYAIPDGANSAFLIRGKRFLKDMLQPGLEKMWPNLKTDMLEMSKDNRSLRMKDDISIMLPQVKSDDGDTYTPELLSFDCEIKGNELIVTTSTQVEVSLGVYGTCFSRSYFELVIGKNKKGEQIINYKKSRKPSIQKGHYSKPGVEIIAEVLKIIAIVLGIVALFLTDGAAIIVIAAALFAMAGRFIITNLQDDALDAAPGLTQMAAHFTGPIIWTSKAMKLTSSGLHSSLRLGGEFA